MGETCSSHGRYEKCINILVGNPVGKNHSEDLSVDMKIILEWILGK
jgi:hypothetical protein